MTRQFKDERRRQQIRVAAIHCFVRRGFDSTRLKDIAAEAGLSKGGVYFHYRTKEALFNDILDVQLRTLEGRWSFTPVVDQPADRTLRRLVVAHLRTLEDEAEETRLSHLLLGMAPRDPAFRDRLRDGHRVMRVLYAGVVARGVQESTFRDGDPDQLATCVLAMVQGLACQAATDPAGRLPVSPDAVADLVLSMLAPPSTVRVNRSARDGATAPMLPA